MYRQNKIKNNKRLWNYFRNVCLISIAIFVGLGNSALAYQNISMLGQNHKHGFEEGQYIDVIKGDDENFIVSINIEEVKLGDALKALTEKIKVGLSWSAD